MHLIRAIKVTSMLAEGYEQQPCRCGSCGVLAHRTQKSPGAQSDTRRQAVDHCEQCSSDCVTTHNRNHRHLSVDSRFGNEPRPPDFKKNRQGSAGAGLTFACCMSSSNI